MLDPLPPEKFGTAENKKILDTSKKISFDPLNNFNLTAKNK